MKEDKNFKVSTLGSQITSVISVMLVLVILGLLGFAGVASRSLSNDIRSNIGFVIKIDPGASAQEVNALKARIAATPGVASYQFASAEAILAEESAMMGDDIEEMLGQNPFGPEFDVKMTPAYACSDSIAVTTAALSLSPVIDEIVSESAVVDSINSSLARLTLILGAMALALLAISIVLINNTVSLAVYSRRFIIHTMRLVGATAAFIRRPFMAAGALTGLCASLIAVGLLAGLRVWAEQADAITDSLLPWGATAAVLGAVALAGPAICLLAAMIATTRYLRTNYDEMFN